MRPLLCWEKEAPANEAVWRGVTMPLDRRRLPSGSGGFVHAGYCLEEGTVAPWPLPLSPLPTLGEAVMKQFVFCLWREMLLFVLSWGRLQLVIAGRSLPESSQTKQA